MIDAHIGSVAGWLQRVIKAALALAMFVLLFEKKPQSLRMD